MHLFGVQLLCWSAPTVHLRFCLLSNWCSPPSPTVSPSSPFLVYFHGRATAPLTGLACILQTFQWLSVNKHPSWRYFLMQKCILKWKINPSFYSGDNFCIYMASTITVMILIWVFDHVWDLVFFTRTHARRNLVINGPTWLMNAISVYDYNVLFAQVSVKKQNAAIKPRKTRPLWFIVGFSTIKLYILSCQYGLLASFWATRRWSINIY